MILENPTRRDIIKRLSEEPNYPLQLAKDLGRGQQLVAKHLRVMEDAGIVASSIEDSPYGPKRRIYSLNQNMSVTLDVSTHFFKTKIVFFDSEPERKEISLSSASLMDKMDETLELQKEFESFTPFTKIISEIDKKLETLENERSILLYIRNYAMKEASHLLDLFKNSDTRRIIRYALDEHDISVKNISESLNLREAVVSQVLSNLKKDFNIGVEFVDEE
ncbi:ArsR family transcriptional regulator [Candidatus Bathyarchaeota archaeon]|nr:ArsR family transcriptional regulator [Candidatus Bathyarchaeota archaeon]